jgi:hypothetical protein
LAECGTTGVAGPDDRLDVVAQTSSDDSDRGGSIEVIPKNLRPPGTFIIHLESIDHIRTKPPIREARI